MTDLVYCVIIPNATGTRFVSLHKSRYTASQAADAYNQTHKRGTRAIVTHMTVQP